MQFKTHSEMIAFITFPFRGRHLTIVIAIFIRHFHFVIFDLYATQLLGEQKKESFPLYTKTGGEKKMQKMQKMLKNFFFFFLSIGLVFSLYVLLHTKTLYILVWNHKQPIGSVFVKCSLNIPTIGGNLLKLFIKDGVLTFLHMFVTINFYKIILYTFCCCCSSCSCSCFNELNDKQTFYKRIPILIESFNKKICLAWCLLLKGKLFLLHLGLIK